MIFDFSNLWFWFCIAFAAMLLATFIMGRLAPYFITMDPVRRNISMMELEFPGKEVELSNIMQGIFRLPEEEREASIRSLKGQLITDFLLFMPGAYGGIFLLCMKMADKMGNVGDYIFTWLAWAQVLCFALDAIENVYFWSQIKPTAKASTTTFRLMMVLEILKWGMALSGAVCGFSAATYFWLSGQYGADTLPYLGLFAGLIIVFLLVGKTKRVDKTGT